MSALVFISSLTLSFTTIANGPVSERAGPSAAVHACSCSPVVLTRSPVAHKFHVSTGRVAVEGRVIVNKTRFFKDDLEGALSQFAKLDHYSMDNSARTDSLFSAYFKRHFIIEVNGDSLAGTILSSGEDVEGKQAVWWYAVQYEASLRVKTMTVHNTLLTEYFDDQKNVLKVQSFPSEHTSSYYFDGKDTKFKITL